MHTIFKVNINIDHADKLEHMQHFSLQINQHQVWIPNTWTGNMILAKAKVTMGIDSAVIDDCILNSTNVVKFVGDSGN